MAFFKQAYTNAFDYFRDSLELPNFFVLLGSLLWIGTCVSAGLTANHVGVNPDARLYWAVLGTTGATIVPLTLDYSTQRRYWTPITVALGSFAYLTSVALWSREISNPYRLATFITQTAAVSIQLAAIFNHGRPNVQGRYRQDLNTNFI